MVKYKAKRFSEKHQINSSSTSAFLKFVIHRCGHNVSTYSEEILKLTALKLNKEIEKAPAICLKDENGDITVYYNDTLPEETQRMAFAHELGHIELGHIHKNLKGEKQEKEADEFANYLLGDESRSSIILSSLKLFLLIPIMCVCLLLLSIIFPASKTQNSSTSFSFAVSSSFSTVTSSLSQAHTDDTICYFSKYGEVYHLYSDCYYLKNSKSVFSTTVGNCHLERLCSACERRKQKTYP